MVALPQNRDRTGWMGREARRGEVGNAP